MDLFVDKMVAASLKLLSEMEFACVPSNENASTKRMEKALIVSLKLYRNSWAQ